MKQIAREEVYSYVQQDGIPQPSFLGVYSGMKRSMPSVKSDLTLTGN